MPALLGLREPLWTRWSLASGTHTSGKTSKGLQGQEEHVFDGVAE